MAIGTTAAIALGAGALGSAFFQSRASGQAAKATGRASSEALGYQREQDAYERKREERAYADYQKRYNDWDAMRRAIFAKHGVSLPGGGGAPGAGADVSGKPGAGQYPARMTRHSLGTMIDAVPAPGTPMIPGQGTPMAVAPQQQGAAPAQQPGTLGTMDQWSNWNQYLGRA
jgi:hypothetical protein